LARFTNGCAHIVLIGRNSDAANAILASLPTATDSTIQWKREFIQCDVSLMKNVKSVSQGLLAELPKINYLVLSAGFGSFRGRHETEEGIDEQLALRYFHRWKFIFELLPLIHNARDAGEDARVMSVLAAGLSFFVNTDDLGMTKSYSGFKAALATPGYNDYMVDVSVNLSFRLAITIQEFARREQGIAFTHIFPGMVLTGQFNYSNRYLKLFSFIIDPLLKLLLESEANCAQYMWYGLIEGKEGFFRRNEKGDNIGTKNYPADPRVRTAIWDYSAQVTDC
jgi:NAD(P)-dependent dehydrogenase (short-subunit alcohol dehydrogenase family)